MYYVYALTTKDKDRIYVGMTTNLEARIKEHNSGKMKSTKGYRPWFLFYFEEKHTSLAARIREKKLKSGAGKEFLRKILKGAPVAQQDRASAFKGEPLCGNERIEWMRLYARKSSFS